MERSLRFAAYAFFGLAISAFPIRADEQHPARPGTLNYVEGQVYLGTRALDATSIGKVELDPSESLTTKNGKAEVLLTPGVFVRVGDSSSATMISSGLTNTQMSIDRGEALVEVAEIRPENVLRIVEDGASTLLRKTGLYDFDENLHVVRVMEGEALVESGDSNIKLKSGHMVDLATNKPMKAQKFDKKEIEAEDLYHWTSLRSGYLAEANADYAPTYSFGGFGWFGDGWYWDPWFGAYTFLPGDGIFYSPFGWGFYSPWCAYGAPFFGGGHYYHHFSPTYGAWGAGAHYGLPVNYGRGVRYASGFRAGSSARGSRMGSFRGGFHGGGGGFHGGGGGFHGGGGGFHGGGGGHH
jgi:hypothetical protein